jgi:hypothetical protein
MITAPTTNGTRGTIKVFKYFARYWSNIFVHFDSNTHFIKGRKAKLNSSRDDDDEKFHNTKHASINMSGREKEKTRREMSKKQAAV